MREQRLQGNQEVRRGGVDAAAGSEIPSAEVVRAVEETLTQRFAARLMPSDYTPADASARAAIAQLAPAPTEYATCTASRISSSAPPSFFATVQRVTAQDSHLTVHP